MRFLVALAVALILSIGGGMVLGEAQSAVTHFLNGNAPRMPQHLPVYPGPAKNVARQPSQGRPAPSQPRAATAQKSSRHAPARRPS